VDLPIGHCEISWEGDKSRLASPDTGLEAIVQVMLRAATSGHLRTVALFVYRNGFPPHFLIF